ncbi:hypothetical protein NHX12_027169, partial [Muraenolepis orangiensis]
DSTLHYPVTVSKWTSSSNIQSVGSFCLKDKPQKLFATSSSLATWGGGNL